VSTVAVTKPPGIIVVQLDGLAASTLERAISAGYMPTLQGWLASGRHRLVSWDCGVPSMTSSSQAGILYGRNEDIPGFRWYEKERKRLLVSNHPGDAAELERRLSPAEGLLERDGSSLANLLSGDARRTALTLSALGRGLERSDEFYLYLLNPTTFWQTFGAAVREVLLEIREGWRQRLRNVRPRVGRGGSFPFLRAASNVVLRDLTAHMLRQDMELGVRIAYSTFVGYDVVAHHAGPERPDALRVLRELDGLIAALEQSADEAPRRYAFVVLSDHGQVQGATFRQRYGRPLEELVRELAHARSVAAPRGRGETWGYLSALLSEAVQGEQRAARRARRVLRPRTRGPYVEVGPDRYRKRRQDAEVVVCASGGLGLVYLADWPGRLSLEGIENVYPGLIEGLVAHEGIAFCMVGSEQHGPVVLGPAGLHRLEDGWVEGVDPLASFGPEAEDHLRRLHAFRHVGDVVVIGRYDPLTGEVTAFEELVGSHGGLGGKQNVPFLLFPAGWPLPGQPIVGAADVHRLLRGWLERLDGAAS
jgi:hypothetical protein